MFGSFDGPVSLNVSKLELSDQIATNIATIIAEETEAERERQRVRLGEKPKSKNGSTNYMVGLLAPDGNQFSYADTLRWEILLSHGDCVVDCAKRAGVHVPELLQFASQFCSSDHIWLLFWMRQYWLASNGKTSAEMTAEMQAKELERAQNFRNRISEGGRAGGIKSAQKRRQNSRTPELPVLQMERQRLLMSGVPANRVNARLAKSHNVSPATIRSALRKN